MNPGEQRLDQWMRRHAFVTWVETDAPWQLEAHLLSSGLSLPLNINGNPCLEAVAPLSAVRLKARQLADELEIIADWWPREGHLFRHKHREPLATLLPTAVR
jgi:GIY-YIG catalytic domain-containing protein